MSNVGENIRLARLFAGGQNLVVVAVDHGLYFGPLPGLIDLPGAVSLLGGADAILMSPGMPGHCQEVFSVQNGPKLMVRVNWGSNYAAQWKYRHSHSVHMCSVADAVAEGADLVIASLTLQNPDEAEDARNIEMFSRYVAEKRALGIPLVGEVYPTGGDDAKPEELQEAVFIGCRIVAELGADLVKTFYTGEGFAKVTAATPIPVLALGAKKLPSSRDALALAAAAIASGARGVVFGRNVVQSAEPGRLLDALKEVVKHGGAPDTVARKFRLE